MLNGKHQATFPNILGLAGTELTCSIAAPMEMCFGFVTKTVLVIEILRLQLDRACTESRISFPSPSSRQGVGNRPGGDSQEHPKYILESNQVHRHSTNCDIFMVFNESFIRDHLGSKNERNM